jgi:hypothetical protein
VVAIDRLPSGNFRARLMINGKRYTSTLPSEADASLWEVEDPCCGGPASPYRDGDVRRLRHDLARGVHR